MNRRPNGWGQDEELLNSHLESQVDELGNTVSSLRDVRLLLKLRYLAQL